MKTALSDKPQKELTPPENVVAVPINSDTGLLARNNDRSTIMEFFRDGEIPGQTNEISGTAEADENNGDSQNEEQYLF